MGSEKMSKSLGNVKLIHDLRKDWDGEVIRLALLKAHYRSELVWTEDLLKESKAQLDGWYRIRHDNIMPEDWFEGLKLDFDSTILSDLNTPEFLAQHTRVNKVRKNWVKIFAETGHTDDAYPLYGSLVALFHSLHFLGLLQKDPEEWFKGGASADEEAEFDAIALRRQEARAAKNWVAADAARDEATARGIVLEDGPEGTSWRKG